MTCLCIILSNPISKSKDPNQLDNETTPSGKVATKQDSQIYRTKSCDEYLVIELLVLVDLILVKPYPKTKHAYHSTWNFLSISFDGKIKTMH